MLISKRASETLVVNVVGKVGAPQVMVEKIDVRSTVSELSSVRKE
jgi:DUF917 family protein